LNWETESARLVDLYHELAPGVAASPDPQRITFVLPSSGEFDSRTRRMASTLGSRGHDVLVIARAEMGLPTEAPLPGGGRLVRVDAGRPVPPLGAHVRGPARMFREGIRLARTGLRTRTQARAARQADRPADIYHAMAFLALPVAADLAARARAPFVYDARDLYAEANNIARLPGLLRTLFARRERRWAQRAAAVLTVNGALADELARRLDIERPTVILNTQAAWTPPEPPPDHLRQTLGLPAGTRLALYHGGLMGDRGLPELIAAMRSLGLDGAHLAIMGEGPLAAQLATLAAAPDLGGRVHLLPPVPPAELLEWVASADVGVMPNQPATINERLSTPNKLFECLAAGVPVVSSDFPERRRIVIDDPEGPLGALCDPTSPASIGAAIRSILDLDPAARAELRARCLRAAAARYTWEAQVPALLATYTRVTGKPW
jgi:glycosyltransferase involved in cell wall biosynthesis